MRAPTETVPVLRTNSLLAFGERRPRAGQVPATRLKSPSSYHRYFFLLVGIPQRATARRRVRAEVLRGASCYVSRSLEFCVRFLPCFLLAFRHETTPSGALLRVPVCETASFGRLVFNSTPRFAGTGLSRTSCNQYLRAPAYCVSPVQLIEKDCYCMAFHLRYLGERWLPLKPC